MDVEGKHIALFPSEEPGAPLVVLNAVEEEAGPVWSTARAMAKEPFSLAVITGLDWDEDLTPWPAPSAFRGGKSYGGRADAFLEALTDSILPKVLAELPEAPRWLGLAGYSLAGLFALYAPCRTKAFARVASASGSMWYPGFLDFVRERGFARQPDRVFLSVGDREARTRNPMLRPVEENTRALAELYAGQGIPTAFELNPGGHFQQPVERTARAIAWLVDETLGTV